MPARQRLSSRYAEIKRTNTTVSIAKLSIRPYIIQPKKRCNYKTLLPTYSLVVLTAGITNGGGAAAEISISNGRSAASNAWSKTISIPATTRGNLVQYHKDFPLNIISREEQANVPTDPARTAKPQHAPEGVTVTCPTIETAKTRTKPEMFIDTAAPLAASTLNPLSPSWSPHASCVLSALSPAWDPFGNRKTHSSPTYAQIRDAQSKMKQISPSLGIDPYFNP